MRRFRRETGRPWILVGGLELVSEQAVAQFELLTGRKAPRRLMTLEALQNYVGEDGPLDEKEIQARLGYTYQCIILSDNREKGPFDIEYK